MTLMKIRIGAKEVAITEQKMLDPVFLLMQLRGISL